MNLQGYWRWFFNGNTIGARWLDRRIPRQKKQRLSHKNIFILPSKASISFAVLVIALWLLGINYQNNLVLVLAFFLFSLIITSIFHTYKNLSGLLVEVISADPCFMGEIAHIRVRVSGDFHSSQSYRHVVLQWAGGDEHIVSLDKQQQQLLSLTIPVQHRGWFQPPRLHIFTHYPLGLSYAWSYLAMDIEVLVYPKPLASTLSLTQCAYDDQDNDDIDYQKNTAQGYSDEFAGLRQYQHGDPLRDLDWRSYARGQGLSTKMYEEYVGQALWLDWEQLSGLNREQRLSYLCAAVLHYSQTSTVYGLSLPNITIAPNQGEAHLNQVLKALALYEWQAAKQQGGQKQFSQEQGGQQHGNQEQGAKG